MDYVLRHFDNQLIGFSATENSDKPEITIHWVNESTRHLLPLDLDLSPEGLTRWLRRRTIPKNRAYVSNLLSKCGLSINRPMDIIRFSKGLSLNDCYWIVEDGFEGSFDDFNLYDNRFSKTLALIAFTGYGSHVRTSLVSSPEFTTNGMLPKCWRRIGGRVMLYKGGTTGASNAGNEPYSEFYASKIAEISGVNAIQYRLSIWKGELCSTCELFTNKDEAFLPIGNLVNSWSEAVDYYKGHGPQFIAALNDMLVFDALICNTDRHLGNFGFLVDNRQNKIVAPAPLFDHGNSLFNFAGRDDWISDSALTEYASTLQPRLYDDFIGTAKQVLETRHREGLRHLVNFKLRRHSRYNLPKEKVKLIEKQVQRRARTILENK